MLWALALAAALSAPARAAECAPLGGIGCFYVPDSLPRGAKPPLLVYFRGHWGDYKGSVPVELRTASARDALDQFELHRLAETEKIAILVTGSSDVGVSNEVLSTVRRKNGLEFGALYFASHSGGYLGLSSSIGRTLRADRIVMLDNFYFGTDLARVIQQQVAAGSVCTGFYTKHNQDRWERYFKNGVYCPVDTGQGIEHNASVNRCLGKYLKSTTCR
ncbi:MAG: hypothetical protein HY925_16175 [Elusimicrobia bacterium]|nr:hypothetical protein [Elusimicrobiota bacterium]